jgi:hypothetical protein
MGFSQFRVKDLLLRIDLILPDDFTGESGVYEGLPPQGLSEARRERRLIIFFSY